MGIYLQRNSTDLNQIEVVMVIGGDEIVCGIVLVDAICEGARGMLGEIANCIRGKKEVVLVLKEEWNDISDRR